MNNPIQNRYDFVILFDVKNGNPNGDPDAGNAPREDLETGIGLVTDVCIKRKIRNYVEMKYGSEEGFDMYIKAGLPLKDKDKEILKEKGFGKEDEVKEDDDKKKVIETICSKYYDVRTFGAVVTTFQKFNGGQIRGPVQLNFAKSIDPINSQNISITRIVKTDKADSSTFGEKYIIPYALYRQEGYISANFAKKTGFNEEDLEIFWEAIIRMFEEDHSAARGEMILRKLVIFKHESEYGNAPAHELFERVIIKAKQNENPDFIPRDFKDYEITVDNKNTPHGVTILEKKLSSNKIETIILQSGASTK